MKKWQKFIGAIVLGSVLASSCVVEAYNSWSGVMNRRATAYTDANLTRRNGVEYADKGDSVTILNESTKAYLVRYPLSRGGYKERWVDKGAVSGNNNSSSTSSSSYQQWSGVMNKRAIAYTDANLTRRNGVEYADKGDSVTVLNESTKAYLVKYPLSRGGYKERWVDKGAVSRNNTSTLVSGAATGIQAVLDNNSSSYQQWQGKASRKATAYRDADLRIRKGVEYVGAGDIVTVLNESDKAYYVRYPLTRGGTKDRWVDKSAIENVSINNSSSVVNSDAGLELNVPYYMQTDSKWKNTKIGTKTIGSVGCLLTCLAMKYSYQTGQEVYPDQMKHKLNFSNNCLIWDSIKQHGFIYSENQSFNNNVMQEIYNALANNKPVIIGNSNIHWVIVKGYQGNNSNKLSANNFIILDPATQNRKTLQSFFNQKGVHSGRIVY